MPIIAALVVFAAIVCLVLGLMSKPTDVLEARMATLRGDGRSINAFAPEAPETFSQRMLSPMAASFGAKLEKLLPTTWIAGIENGLQRCGQPVSTQGFLMGAAMCFGGCTFLGFMM